MWYAVLAVVMVTVVLVLGWYVDNAPVHDVVQGRLGSVRPEPGVQVFTLYGPPEGNIQHPDSVALSLEFPGRPMDEPQITGRYRLVVKDGNAVVIQRESDAMRSCNWHKPLQGVVLDLNAKGTPFAIPVPKRRYTIEFEWLELPETAGESILHWSYPTRADYGIR
jgi:hypothetical protein